MTGQEPGTRSIDALSVWIDDPDPFFRAGTRHYLAQCGVQVVGESVHFCPQPEFPQGSLGVLVFPITSVGVDSALAIVALTGAVPIGIAPAGPPSSLVEPVKRGVRGVLMRGALNPERLLNCLKVVVDGQTSIPVEAFGALLHQSETRTRDALKRANLTGREVSVLELLAEGHDTHEVARRLCYADRTVKGIVHDILVKLHCKTRAHAVAQASREGFI